MAKEFDKKNIQKIIVFRYKLTVADAVIGHLQPIQRKIADLLQDPQYLISILQLGAEKATNISEKTLIEVKNKLGLTLQAHRANKSINSNN